MARQFDAEKLERVAAEVTNERDRDSIDDLLIALVHNDDEVINVVLDNLSEQARERVDECETILSALESIMIDGRTKTFDRLSERERKIVRRAFYLMYTEGESETVPYISIRSENKYIDEKLEGGLNVALTNVADMLIVVSYDGGGGSPRDKDARDKAEAQSLPFVMPIESTYFTL